MCHVWSNGAGEEDDNGPQSLHQAAKESTTSQGPCISDRKREPQWGNWGFVHSSIARRQVPAPPEKVLGHQLESL